MILRPRLENKKTNLINNDVHRIPLIIVHFMNAIIKDFDTLLQEFDKQLQRMKMAAAG